MYAMSVSPLTREILEKLGMGTRDWGLEQEAASRKARCQDEDGGKKLKKARDFTNNIKIAGEVFEIKTIKGKKTVILPWEKLVPIRDEIPFETVYKGLKGVIILNGVYVLLDGEKLKLIFSLVPLLDMENALNRDWPRKKNFNSAADLQALLGYMDSLARPARWKKDSKELGFLGLFTDGSGNYWLRCSRGFHTSLNESIASLETLIDELDNGTDIGMKHIVNQTYRRLSDMVRQE
jgi:hypothetical protein